MYNDEVTSKPDSACAQISNNFNWIKTEFADDSADRSMYKAKLHAGEVEVMILQHASFDDFSSAMRRKDVFH